MYLLIETAKLNGVSPQAYLTDVLTRTADNPAKRVTDLLPWNWQLAHAKPLVG
jgi:transposase